MRLKNFLIIFLVLWYSRFFSFMGFNLDDTLYGQISHIFELAILALCYNSRYQKSDYSLNFTKEIKWVAYTALLGLIPAILLFGQGPLKGITSLLPLSLFCLYFIFHTYKYTENDILFILMTCGISYAFIHVIQQFTYPSLFFCEIQRINDVTGDVEMRNGLWRILMQGRELSIIMTYYSFYRYLKNKERKYLLITTLGVASIYLNLGRMWDAQCAATMLIIYILSSGKKFNVKYFIGFGIAIFLVQSLETIVGSEILSNTSDELSSSDYIRWVSYDYFWTQSIKNVFVFFLGHGPIGGTSAGAVVTSLAEDQGIYASDVGIVGILFKNGAIYICALLYYYISIMRKTFKLYWVFAYILPVMLFLIMMPTMYGPDCYISACVMLYLADIELNRINSNNI